MNSNSLFLHITGCHPILVTGEQYSHVTKEAAVISVGTEASDLDLNIRDLCDQVLALSE
jgi:hypothetical protein